jgi:hypothetical protein
MVYHFWICVGTEDFIGISEWVFADESFAALHVSSLLYGCLNSNIPWSVMYVVGQKRMIKSWTQYVTSNFAVTCSKTDWLAEQMQGKAE